MYQVQDLAAAIQAQLQALTTIPNAYVEIVPVVDVVKKRTPREIYANKVVVQGVMHTEAVTPAPIAGIEQYFQRGELEFLVKEEYAQTFYNDLQAFVNQYKAKSVKIGSGDDVYTIFPAYDMPAVGSTEPRPSVGFTTTIFLYFAFSATKGGVFSSDVHLGIEIGGSYVDIPVSRASVSFVSNVENNQVTNYRNTRAFEQSQTVTIAANALYIGNAALSKILTDRIATNNAYSVQYSDPVVSFTLDMLVTSASVNHEAGKVSTVDFTLAQAFGGENG